MEKLNIAEILRHCPKGMELNCTIYENATFEEVRTCCSYPIKIITDGWTELLTEYGCISHKDNAKCVIFPKGKTTWEGFQGPFKDGDILIGKSGEPFIFKRLNNSRGCYSYCGIDLFGQFKLESDDWTFANSLRFATEEEKQKLFDAIKANGYKWNPETKTLVKLEKEKFDITTLKPFDKVLVRDTNGQVWTANLFSHVLDSIPRLPITFVCVSRYPNQCIPYESNEHLLGTTIGCDDYYKTWE